jgi:multidrug efflux pump subunit AcrB
MAGTLADAGSASPLCSAIANSAAGKALPSPLLLLLLVVVVVLLVVVATQTTVRPQEQRLQQLMVQMRPMSTTGAAAQQAREMRRWMRWAHLHHALLSVLWSPCITQTPGVYVCWCWVMAADWRL